MIALTARKRWRVCGLISAALHWYQHEVMPADIDNVETQLSFWDPPASKDVIEEAVGSRFSYIWLAMHERFQEKRPPVHVVAPDLQLSKDALTEFEADLEEARVTGAVAEQLEVPTYSFIKDRSCI